MPLLPGERRWATEPGNVNRTPARRHRQRIPGTVQGKARSGTAPTLELYVKRLSALAREDDRSFATALGGIHPPDGNRTPLPQHAYGGLIAPLGGDQRRHALRRSPRLSNARRAYNGDHGYPVSTRPDSGTDLHRRSWPEDAPKPYFVCRRSSHVPQSRGMGPMQNSPRFNSAPADTSNPLENTGKVKRATWRPISSVFRP